MMETPILSGGWAFFMRRQYDMKDVRSARMLYDAGMSIRQVAEFMNASKEWVRVNVQARDRSKAARMQRSREEGKSYEALERKAFNLVVGRGLSQIRASEILGVNQATISDWLIKARSKEGDGFLRQSVNAKKFKARNAYMRIPKGEN
jgi:transposase